MLDHPDKRVVLSRLMAAYGAHVFSFCLRILKDRALAEDTLQQVFIEVGRDVARFQRRSSLRSWILGIAAHRSLDALKAQKRREARHVHASADDRLEDDAPSVATRLDEARLVDALEKCLALLSPESRGAVLMRFHSGMSYEEMSAALNVKADTLNARVARALPSLRECLEQKGWNG